MTRDAVVPFLETKRLFLRPLQEEDINVRYLSWLNDKGVNRHTETGVFPSTLNDLRKFYRDIAASKTDIMLAIVVKRNNLHIGNIKLGGINWVHRFADLGILIGDKGSWNKGYGQEACLAVLDYAFGKLNLNKIILGVSSIHAAAINAYKNVGFVIEGRLKRMINLDGVYVDRVIMGLLRNDYKNLLEDSKRR